MAKAISAIILAIDMITKYCKKNKFRKSIALITDGKCPVDGDDIEGIAKKLDEENIELKVL